MASDVLSSNSYGLATNTHWSGVSSVPICAFKSLLYCPGSRGFVYNPSAGLCIPLLWLQMGSGGATLGSADPLEWKVFVTNGLCRNGFEAYDYGSEGHFSCFKIITSSYEYSKATTECNALGGYLASVKTVDELNVVRGLAGSKDHWVGMDDLAKEGVHIWQEDGQRLTSEQQQTVFKPGEPNNYYGVEDCIHFRGSHQNLNDVHCWSTKRSVCESAPLTVTC
ncbi:lectin [Elysia marginata]|uniref:Lectin n=1 Tax=Elysia marginata TaxID=1093978 RepID=A0AAV4J8U1_9GAST|nr:lectin [Elysia marginata]